MKLSDELFEAIVGCDSLCTDRGRATERRTVGRIRLPARVQVIPLLERVPGKAFSAQVRDMSQTGIGMLMPMKVIVGNNLLVRLQSKEITAWVYCDVARAERVSEGLYVVGATFLRTLDPSSTLHAAAR